MFNDHSYLYVEDDSRSREIMQMIMRNAMGIDHLTVMEDSKDFMTRLHALQPRPDVIILDIHLKPHSGFEMLDMLRGDAQFKDATIVALTASVMNEEVQQLQQSGFDAAIGKPVSIQTFPQLMERILKGETVWHVA